MTEPYVKYNIQNNIATIEFFHPEQNSLPSDVLKDLANTITEVGKTTRMDASGKVTSIGKYMAIWEKRNGKYICVRDISNNDSKEN